MAGEPLVPARFCTRCGSECPAGARFCTSCGAPFDRPVAHPEVPAPAAPAVVDEPAPATYSVAVELPYQPAPSRSRTAARWPLAVPALVVWLVLLVACAVTGPVGWVAAIATGRLPDRLRRFHTAVLVHVTRASAYLAMATDVPPPMPWRGAAAHPLQVKVRPAARLPRLRTLLIVPISLPAVMTSFLFGVVTWMLSVGAWAAILVTGRLPRTIHDMQMLAIRFQCRTLAFVPLLLMRDYPWYERGPVLLPGRRG